MGSNADQLRESSGVCQYSGRPLNVYFGTWNLTKRWLKPHMDKHRSIVQDWTKEFSLNHVGIKNTTFVRTSCFHTVHLGQEFLHTVHPGQEWRTASLTHRTEKSQDISSKTKPSVYPQTTIPPLPTHMLTGRSSRRQQGGAGVRWWRGGEEATQTK